MSQPPHGPETPSSTGAEQPLEWIDGHDRPWRIDADTSRVALTGPQSCLEVTRERFTTDLYFAGVGNQVVVRFASPDEEVGFLVPRAEAAELLRRIGYDPTPRARAVEQSPAAARGPMWPKMTATAVWGLICASLAFLPFVGIAFALVAGVLIWIQRLASRPTTAMLHVRWMVRISTILLLWGLAVWALSTWTWFQPSNLESVTVSEADEAAGQSDWTIGILSLLVVLASLSVHEAAHAISAWWCGDDYARSLGRVTLNPMAHIDLFGTVLLPAILWMSGGIVFGYARPVPVRVAGIRRFRRAHILISIAGPGSNLLLAAVSLSLLFASGCVLRRFLPPETMTVFADLWSPGARLTGFALAPLASVLLCGLKLMFLINLFLAAFNLIPVPPLDGSWVLEHLFPGTLGRIYAHVRRFGILVFIALIYTDVLQYLLLPAVIALFVAEALLEACVVG
ncbi:MAG: site-2 protease family protein [Planctomycetota bacterium]|jgi:Zn-dependent protease